MPNDFYTPTGNPADNSAIVSTDMRAEFAAINAGFNKLPTLTGNANKFVAVNASGTGLDVRNGIIDNAASTLITLGSDGITYLGSSAALTSFSLTPNKLFLSSDTAGGTDFVIRRSVAGGYSGSMAFARSRGNAAAPSALINGDPTGLIYAHGFDGTNYQNSAYIYFGIDNTVSAGRMPGTIKMLTSNFSTGTLTESFCIDSAQTVTLGSPAASPTFKVVKSGMTTAYYGLTVSGGNFVSRGISDTATAVALSLSGSGANSVTIANSATNPTIGTSGGLLSLSSTTVFAGSSAPVATVTGLYGNSTAIGFTDSTRAADSRVFDATFSGGSFKIRALTDAYSAAANAISIAGGYGAGITAINFSTSAAGAASTTQVSVTHTAGADRYITLTGSNGGNPTIGTSGGGLVLAPGGAGEASHVFIASNTGAATPVRATTLGLAIGANYSAGPGEVNFYNSFYTASASFDFRQITASGVSASVARFIPIASGTAGLAIVQGSAATNARIGTEAASNIVIGTGSALATTATTNHMMIPTCAGAPTGVPVGAGAGQLAVIYDTTNNFLYAYNGGWKKSTVYA